MTKTVKDKFTTAANYVLLAGASLGRQGYGMVPPYKVDHVTVGLFLVDRDKLGNHSWMVRFDGIGWTAWVGPAVFPPNDREGASFPGTESLRFELDGGFDADVSERDDIRDWLDRHEQTIGTEYQKFLDTYPRRHLLRTLGIEMKPYQIG